MFAHLLGLGVAASLTLMAGYSAVVSADEKPPDRLVIDGKGLTVNVRLTEAVREGLKAVVDQRSANVNFRLSLDGLVPPPSPEQIKGIRVFVNKPDAKVSTSTKDVHFVGSFTFAPVEGREPINQNLSLTSALRELSKKGDLDPVKPLQITLLVVPGNSSTNLPKDFAIPLKQLTVQVVETRK